MSHAIRPARPEEVDEVIGALEWLFAPPGSRPPLYDPERARAAVARAIEDPGATVLVAEVDSDIGGVCTVFLDVDSIRFGQRAWVEDLAVDPARRSTGVGKALLDAAKAWGRERGATHLELDSGDTRTDAHRFYEREQPDWSARSFAWVL